jgi:hypothetical protein
MITNPTPTTEPSARRPSSPAPIRRARFRRGLRRILAGMIMLATVGLAVSPTPAQATDWLGTSTPLWFFGLSSWRCAGIPGAQKALGVQADIYPCTHGATNQQWHYEGPSGAIDRYIVNVHSHLCLTDVAGRAEQERCVWNASQQWESTAPISNGLDSPVWIQNTATHRCLTAPSPTTFTRLTLTTCDLSNQRLDQQWLYFLAG